MRRAGLVVERVEDGDGPELRIRKAAARRRIVSGGWIWPGRRELSCYFKYMARGRIPEFESYHPSHAVRLIDTLGRAPMATIVARIA